jgi:hypothetical protein
MKQFYYTTEVPFMCFNSNEEVDMEDDYELGKVVTEPKLIWQEGVAKCKGCGFVMTMLEQSCPKCEGKNFEEIQPIYFDNWEAADAWAAKYWEKKFAEMKMEVKDD